MKSKKVSSQGKQGIVSFDAPPLDFANLNIKVLTDLKLAIPRQGKKKTLQEQLEEHKDENKRKNEKVENNLNNQNQQVVEKLQEVEQDREGEEEEKEKEKERREKEKLKEQRGIPSIIRTISPNQVTFSLATQQAQNTGQKGQHSKVMDELNNSQNKKKINIQLVQSSLVLSYNKIRSLNNFYNLIDQIMYDCKNLQWIDIAHNQIETLDYGFNDFPNLKSLYLHGNYIKDLKDLTQLSDLNLRTLTIHGNPVDTIPNFRLYIIGMLPSLVKLDSVLISKKELDNAIVWKINFHQINPPLPKVIIRPTKSQGGA